MPRHGPSRIETAVDCDARELAAMCQPRDDVLVAERESARSADHVCLVAAAGPWREYSRTLRWTTGADDTYVVRQRVEYRLAIPYWGWLYQWPVRRTLPTGLPHGQRPWWSTPDRLSPRQSTVVATMATFNLIAGLLYGLLTQVLTFVAADMVDGSRTQQTTLLAVARVGVVVTMVAMVFADRIGRRRIAIWTYAAAGVLTLLTALSPTWWTLGALQFLSRNLAIAGLLCVDTIAIEELPPGSRAISTGLGTLAYGMGAGVIVVTLPLADLGDWGWRLTFVVAGLSLPLIFHAARHLPESGRFERLRAGAAEPSAQTTAESAVETAAAPAPRSATRVRPGRFVLIGAIFFLLNVFVAPASQLQNDYLRTDRAFSGLAITLFLVATGMPGGLGVLVGGRIADTRGRKAAIVPGFIAIGVFNVVMFSSSGALMWMGSLLGAVLGGLAVPALGVIAPELFPTGRRTSVRGVITAIAVGGSVCGLLTAGQLVDSRGYSATFTLLAIAPLLGAALAFAIPETRGRELEDINR